MWFLQQIIHYDKGVAGSLSPTSVGVLATTVPRDCIVRAWAPVYARYDGPRFKLPIEGGKGAKENRQVSSLWTERRRRRHRRNFLPSPFPLRAPLSFSPPFPASPPPSLPPHPYPICAHPPPPFRAARTQRVSLPISSPPRGRRDPGRTKGKSNT